MAGRHQQLFQWQHNDQPQTTGMISGFIPVYEKKKRDRSWEQDHNQLRVTYRGIPRHQVDAIKDISLDLAVNTGDIARAFLEFGLHCLDHEELQLTPRPKAQRMTLFPEEGSAPGWKDMHKWNTGKNAITQRKKMSEIKNPTWQSQVSYRGIPGNLHQQVKETADEYCIPQGELVTVFFQYALHAYELGRLQLLASPSKTAQLISKWGAS